MNGESKLGSLVRNRILELHQIAPGSIGDQMGYEILAADEQWVRLRCRTFDWMRNGPGTLHGGMCATVVDQAMGFVAYCAKPGPGTAPTVQLQVEYHRPLIPGEAVIVDVYVVSQSRSLMHLRCSACLESRPERVCLTATATYFYKPAQA